MRYVLIALILTLAACSFRALALLESEEGIRGDLSITRNQKNEPDPTPLQKGIASGIIGSVPSPIATPEQPILVNP